MAGWGRCARRGGGADTWPRVTAGERQTPDPGARVAADANAAPAPTTPPKTETRVRRPRILERFIRVRTVARRPRQNRSRCSPAGARDSRTELRRLTSVKRLMTSRVSYRRPTVQPWDSRIGYSRWLTRCSRTTHLSRRSTGNRQRSQGRRSDGREVCGGTRKEQAVVGPQPLSALTHLHMATPRATSRRQVMFHRPITASPRRAPLS